MQEVGIFAVAVAVVPDHLLELGLLLIVFPPLLVAVGGLGVLQLIKQTPVLINDLGKAPYPGATVE